MAAPMVHASSLGKCLACVVEDGNVASDVVIQLVDDEDDIVLTHQSERDAVGRMLFLAGCARGGFMIKVGKAVCGLHFDNYERIIADLGPSFRDLSIGTLALCALFDCLAAA